MNYEIVHAGDLVLRQRTRKLSRDEITSQRITELIDIMVEKMRAAGGVGLAAPQIGEPLRLVVIEDRDTSHLSLEQVVERQRRLLPFLVLINPEIEVSGHHTYFFEGCLSVPNFLAVVPRHEGVAVKALNEFGEEIQFTARGWPARIIQHELDHLEGTLYIDKMDILTFTTKANHEQNWKRVGSADERSLRILNKIGFQTPPDEAAENRMQRQTSIKNDPNTTRSGQDQG